MRTLFLSLFALSACAPATVDRVQPGALSKDTLTGEWRWLDTVVDVPYGTAATFDGAQSELERITWRIEEDLLLGVRAYDRIDGADPEGDAETPVIAYRILKHFDIRRAYDPRTGEESNVIEENTERPWYERTHLRVDWSTNLAVGGPFRLGGVELTLSDLSTTDPDSRWAPSADDSDGDGTIDHLLVYRQAIATPDATQIPGWGDVPTCLFYGRATHECAPSTIVVSSAFQRVDPEQTYVGQRWESAWMTTFGVFHTERMAYDRDHGVLDSARQRWANRHDLWEDSLRRDAAGRPLCQVGETQIPCESASTADNPTPVLLPFRERTLRPIVLHVSNGFDHALRDQLPRIEAEWNAPIRDTVNQLRRWECLAQARGPRAEAACASEVNADLQAFILCPNNPSLPGDPAACSTDHTGPDRRPDGIPDVARAGDLRYRLLRLVDTPQLESPYGYGPSAVDPVGSGIALKDGRLDLGAGEVIATTANVYTHVLDRLAAGTTELIRLIDGDLPPETFIEGEDLGAWLTAMREHGTAANLPGSVGMPAGRTLTAPGARTALAGMDNTASAALWAKVEPLGRPSSPAEHKAWHRDVMKVVAADRRLNPGPLAGRLAWEAVADSPFDEALWTPETLAASGLGPQAAADPSALANRSPLDPLDPVRQAEIEAGLRHAGEHAVDLDDGTYTNPALVDLARAWRAEGLSYDAIYEKIRDELFVSVALHEIGHTLGLRHNFAGSTDAFNFGPTYWKLRDDGNLAPRHVDPLSDGEREGRIHEHMYSSVMDYHADRNGDWHGLGRYDKAAIKFIYGQLVEVMTEVSETAVLPGIPNAETLGYVAYFHESPVYPAPILGDTDGFFTLHYTDYPRLASLEARADVPYDRLRSRLDLDDPTPSLGGITVLAEGVGDLPAGLPAAPYRFCSDELAGQGLCDRFDAGADPYEITTNHVRTYWDRYLLENFARDRYGFGFGDYAAGLQARTFRPLHRWLRTYALFHTILGAEFDPAAAAYLADDRGLGGWTIAAADTFRFFTQVVTRPEPGDFGPVTRPDGVTLLAPGADDPTLTLPLGVGAWYDSAWPEDAGYWWFERYQRIGTYWDRLLALQALTTLSPYDFIGFDTASDPRAYALGVASLWREPLHDVLGALVADDAARLAPISDGDGSLVWPDPINPAAWPPEGSDGITPGSYWLVRYAAGLLAAGQLREGYDRSWLDRARIYAEGSDEALTPPPGAEVARHTDPQTGITWAAWRHPGEDGRERGAGARMIDQANTLNGRCTALSPDDARIACAELRNVTADLALQGQIVAWFDGEPTP